MPPFWSPGPEDAVPRRSLDREAEGLHGIPEASLKLCIKLV